MSSLLRALFTGTSKHKKLSEEWATLREPVVEGVTFYCKYLGSTLVDDPKGEAATAEAIKRIIHTAKQVARKPERVALHVSLQGIRMEESVTKEVLLQTSIYKISYCSADAHYDHVFAFIATTDNETCECHAFLCPKRKMAQAVTISIAQAFNLAYECWKVSLKNKENDEAYGREELPAEVTVGSVAGLNGARSSQSQPSSQASSPIPIRSDFGSSDMSTSGYQSSSQAQLIDLEDSSEHASSTTGPCQPQGKTAVFSKPLTALEDLGNINDGFSRLALRRGNPPQPMTGMNHLGLGELGLAAFTGHQVASPTKSGFLPSTSPQHAALPLASSPPDPWGESCQSPTEAWEMFSRSPNTAFLHSCQSPPSPSMFPSSLQLPPQPPQPPQSSLQSVEPLQSPPKSPSDTSQFPFAIQSHPEDLCSKERKEMCQSGSQQCNSFPISPTSPTGRENPFLPTTNPFISTTPMKEVASGSSHPSVECPRLVVGPGGGGCSPGRPVWTADFFSGSKSKNVICS